MDTEKAIEAIEDLKKDLIPISTTFEFNAWLIIAKETLSYCFPNSDNPMPMRTATYINGELLNSSLKQRAIKILDGHISILNRFGFMPKEREETMSMVNFSVNQNNHQTQTTTITVNIDIVIDALTDELTGAQVKELKSILESENDPATKKKSFFEKLKEFGENVSSNVLVNILSNPQIYEWLIDKLKR